MSKIRQAQARIRAGLEAEAQAVPPAPRPAAPAPGKIASRQAAAGVAQQLAADVESLKGLTLEAKAAIKKALVEKYRAHAEGFLAAGHQGLADPVVPYWVIWLWDTGDLEGFIKHGRRAEALNQRSPLNTPLREFRWYRVLDWANDELKAGRSPEPYFGDVHAEVEAMPGSIAAGYHTVAGKSFVTRAEAAEKDQDTDVAVEQYRQAKAAFDAAKAVSERARVETALKAVNKKLEQLGQ
jgi:hypothetical protein